MIRPRSLSAKILLLAMLNAVLLGTTFLAFVHFRFRFDPGSFVLAPAREHILSTSRLAALELAATPEEQWTKLLNELSLHYPARFYLFSEDDHRQIAGDPVVLPAALVRRLNQRPLRPGPPPGAVPPPDQAPPFPPYPAAGTPPKFRMRHGNWHAVAELVHTRAPSEYWAAVSLPIFQRDTADSAHAILIWRFQRLYLEPFFFDPRPWIVLVLAALLIPAACWIPFIRGMTNDISTMTAATSRIADGQFEVALPRGRRDELGTLSASITRMSARLSGYVSGQKRFLSDIAHELSSPLARMRMALGILEQRAGDAAAESIADLTEELDEISSLVSELLQFSRSKSARQTVTLTSVNVASLVNRAILREADRVSQISYAIDEDLWVHADTDCFYRALANVIRNAVRYAGSAGPITVSAERAHGVVRLFVDDCGPGIPEPELENVFRPFYRPEFARTRETGGTGLGLAIVRDCMAACGGSVRCENRVPHGLRVILELPATNAGPLSHPAASSSSRPTGSNS